MFFLLLFFNRVLSSTGPINRHQHLAANGDTNLVYVVVHPSVFYSSVGPTSARTLGTLLYQPQILIIYTTLPQNGFTTDIGTGETWKTSGKRENPNQDGGGELKRPRMDTRSTNLRSI